PARGEPVAARAVRPALVPLAWLVRLLAEDRPLWVYPLRPLLAGAIHLWAAGLRVRTEAREGWALALKRTHRAQRIAVHESRAQIRRLCQRASKRARLARQQSRRFLGGWRTPR
ncbi:MAG: hypothetical protein ACRD26_12085, partial [Vicinamibacterales bacterium]